MKKIHFMILLIFSGSLSCFGQGTFQKNLLDVSVWSGNLGAVGTIGSFVSNGGPTQNSIIWDIDPFGRKALVWKCTSNGNNGGNGGWDNTNIPVDDKKAYRVTVWVKKVTASSHGNLYLGCRTALSLAGAENSNPYFAYIPNSDTRFQVGKWYLWVGYIHASNDPDMQSYGAIYDGTTGQKITGISDFKLKVGTTVQTHRAYDYYDVTVGSVTHWYGPRFEEINGAEPTIEQLLGVTGQAATLGKDAYLGGKLSIGTVKNSDPNYKLFVENGIRTRKVKVDQDSWPDYVFDSSYQMTPLDSLTKFIELNGHLPEIPTAKEVEKNGIDLGATQALLLKKIEELTLIVIEQHRRIEELEKERLINSKMD